MTTLDAPGVKGGEDNGNIGPVDLDCAMEFGVVYIGLAFNEPFAKIVELSRFWIANKCLVRLWSSVAENDASCIFGARLTIS